MRFVRGLLVLLFALFVLRSAAPAVAQGEFSTRFTSSYTVSADSKTLVNHQVQFVNLLAGVYASEYTLSIGSTRIKNILASSPSGPVSVTATVSGNTTTIKLTFETPVVGKGQAQRVSLSYENQDIAEKTGSVLEVNIPKLAKSEDFDDYQVIVSVPADVPPASLVTPETTDVSTTSGKRIVRFSKDKLQDAGISILFGDRQTYDFSLRYTLQNPSLTKKVLPVAIPPQTAYQQPFYETMDPKPSNVSVDPDGNWLAGIEVPAKSTLEFRVSGKVNVFLEPTIPVKATRDFSPYLKEALPYWTTTDPAIQALAVQLKTPQAIYDYVVKSLAYNYDRIDSGTERLGASDALQNPANAICTEFTDLFVTLARAAGIPARSQDGFAVTSNPVLRPLSLRLDVLHAWPEYFAQTEKRWIPIDPTWGNTTGGIDYFSRWDLNHIAFVIHGQDSVSPYPAGAYKLTSTSGKDVNVVVSDTEPKETKNVLAAFRPTAALLGLLNLSVTLENRGNTALPESTASLSAPGYNSLSGENVSVPLIPPGGEATLHVALKPQRLIPTNTTLTLNLDGQTYSHELTPTDISLTALPQTLATLAVAGAASFVAYRAGRLLVSRFKERRPLHR